MIAGREPEPQRLVRFQDAGTGRAEVVGRARGVTTMLDVVAHRLENDRAGSRFPLLQLLRRPGPLSSLECGALVFEVARLRVLLASLGIDGDALDGDAFPRAAGPAAPPRSLADVYAWPLRVLDHFARLGAASGDGTRLELESVEAAAGARVPSPALP